MSRLRRALRSLPIDRGRPALPPAGLRAAAVLMAVNPWSDGAPLLFIERGPGLRHHPGQVAFPGGAVAAGDRSLAATALREAEEEIGIDPRSIRLIGQLPPRTTHVSGFQVTAVVGVARRPLAPVPDGVEVAGWFDLPLTALLALPPLAEVRTLPGGERVPAFRYELQGHTVWGATADILHTLLERVRAAP